MLDVDTKEILHSIVTISIQLYHFVIILIHQLPSLFTNFHKDFRDKQLDIMHVLVVKTPHHWNSLADAHVLKMVVVKQSVIKFGHHHLPFCEFKITHSFPTR
jgi:hypothetical protein